MAGFLKCWLLLPSRQHNSACVPVWVGSFVLPSGFLYSRHVVSMQIACSYLFIEVKWHLRGCLLEHSTSLPFLSHQLDSQWSLLNPSRSYCDPSLAFKNIPLSRSWRWYTTLACSLKQWYFWICASMFWGLLSHFQQILHLLANFWKYLRKAGPLYCRQPPGNSSYSCGICSDLGTGLAEIGSPAGLICAARKLAGMGGPWQQSPQQRLPGECLPSLTANSEWLSVPGTPDQCKAFSICVRLEN